jgi:tetratricopeptide (TPR) repeat protein
LNSFADAAQLSPHAHQPPSKPYRDTAKEFLLFIKGGQAAYGALLRAIHEKCPDVSMLGSIASSYLSGNSSGTSTPNPPQRSRVYTVLDDKTAALAISRDSLVYLGDLSRWRHKAHVDRQSQTPQWKKARLYYELAYEVDPDSGLAKHQLAVLAQDDGKYFPALASLYQSLASSFPHPQADNNLEMLMTRRLALPINQIIAKVKPSDDQTNVVATLRAWFLQLHVHFYKGVHFDQHGEMESEVLARLKQALKDGTNLDGTLLSMSLINMAAEFVAHKHAMENVRAQANAQMYFFCFRHNVRTFKILLEHFQEGLESQARTSVTDPDHSTVSLPVSGATLQTIRVYMLWFSVNWSWMQKCIETDSPEPEVAEYIRQLWRLLAHVLNAIYLQYPLFEIPAVSDDDLLVDEEEATMGFRPVQNDETLGVWVSRTRNVMKAVLRRERSAAEVKDHHMVRIRDIYTRALLVASNEVSQANFLPTLSRS